MRDSRGGGLRGAFRWPVNALAGAGRFAAFSAAAVAAAAVPPYYPGVTAAQLARLCRRCLIPVLAVVGPVGMLLALQGVSVLRAYGTEFMVSGLISIALLRELCPAMAGTMIAAQAGSGMAAELGSMRIKEELDATEVMAVDPLKFLVGPRIIAGTLVCPMINLLAYAAGMAGGYIVAVLGKGISPGAFHQYLFRFADPTDIVYTTVKALLFGIILSLVSCYKGYNVKGGAAEVGKGANDAVVLSIILYLAANYVFTTFFFSIKPYFGY